MIETILMGATSIYLLFMIAFMNVNGDLNRFLFRFIPLVLVFLMGVVALNKAMAWLP